MNWKRTIIVAIGIVVLAGAGQSARAVLTVYGGPTYNSATETGYDWFYMMEMAYPLQVNDAGTAVGGSFKIDSGNPLGARAVRMNASGWIELGHLGTYSEGMTYSEATNINASGTSVGYALAFSGDDMMGSRAVRWDAGSTTATELGHLGTDASGYTESEAFAINTAGVIAGNADVYNGDTYLGYRAVRWAAGSTVATELGHLGTDTAGYTESDVYAINTAGTIVGFAEKYDGDTYVGDRAVRWAAGGTVATELGNLGTDSAGETYAEAYAINAAGTAVGFAEKYDGDTDLGYRAVRWAADGTAATELGNLGTDVDGYTESDVYAINDAGTAVGFAEKYDGDTYLGDRAVRWDASGTVATELGNLGTDGNGETYAEAYDINSDGIIVGWAEKYESGTYIDSHAVYWGPDGVAVDLNTLIDPDSGWRLLEADAISDTGWITGIGLYDPDGVGGLDPYGRMYLIQLPEPTTLGLLVVGGVVLLRRKRK